ncbi:hypothetical protein L0128_09750 [candidate division KSB1 bacterium]|nr:hypothetical protein [candidate division KSB1 bacterium]
MKTETESLTYENVATQEVDIAECSEVCHQLKRIIEEARLIKKYHPSRYAKGDMLKLEITGVHPAYNAEALFEIMKFVGGGFAGQVYRVKLNEIQYEKGVLPAFELGNEYAMKILVPPSGFSLSFRNFVYWLAYQGPFSAQVNQAAARAGVLWQKVIRRGAKIYFGTERAVVDSYATFFDKERNSFGEINEWVSGRNWKFEIDDRLWNRKKMSITEKVIKGMKLNSPEYLAKRQFMGKMVRLFHEMGAPELARQYEWWTMKSQPNALLRLDGERHSVNDLCSIDFRAGLALLPFLPMSPADFRLIIQGLFRGNLVQFDRGNLKKLNEFIDKYKIYFKGMESALAELKEVEFQYRRSTPDIFHQGLKLIYSRSLRRDVARGLIQGWNATELADEQFAAKLDRSSIRFCMFYVLGALPFIGKTIRRLWGNAEYARHVKHILAVRGYFSRTLQAKQAAALIDWQRDGRANDERILKLVQRPFRFWLQKVALVWLPPKWHRFFAEPAYAWDSIKETVRYPIRFYREKEFREEWLLEQVEGGLKEGMISESEAHHIRERISDPFIQKYLKCVAVHVCTLPITQVISVIAAIYAMIRYGNTWGEALAYAGLILAAFQATPVSPGSLTRGLYVVYLMIKERDVKNYWVAALVSFWHYIGYLGFPIQMVTKFPALSRLMAGRWATGMVHIIPVFGERGALLEHWVFDMFFNLPISIRRLFKKS